MFNKILLTVMAVVLCVLTVIAQPDSLYSYGVPWSPSPVLHQLPASFKGQSAVYLKDDRIYHYKFEGSDLVQYNYVYKLIKVEDDKGIEMFNKVYLPMYRNTELYDIRARVITAAGTVVNVPENKIKEEESDGRLYKLFAMEGIDKGAEIEYSYKVKKAPVFFGTEIFQSTSVPYYKARLLVITPEHLKFDAKGYNGFTVLKDSLINDERMVAGYSENIMELDDEKYGFREPYQQRADFKLSYNIANNSNVEMYTWKEFARKAYANISTFSEKEKKAIAKFINGADIPADVTEEKTVMLLEDFMKTRINVDDNLVGDDLYNIEAIIKKANTNNWGAARFFVAMLENRNIRYQVVFPSVRNQLPLDEDLANWNRAEELLIYLPGTGKLLEPSALSLRYPFVEAYEAGTRGLFLKGTTIGDIKTAVGKFEDIPTEPFENNAHNMEMHVRLDASGDSLIIDSKQIFKGYAAIYYRPIWTFLTKDKQDEMVKGIIQSVAKSENIQNIKTENTNLTDAWDNKPLIISATIHTAEQMERAGNKLLFKLGELIGNQEQMYQEKKRQLPAELQYAHVLERKISFDIPEGYTIKNLNDINIDIQSTKGNVVSVGFVSTYKVVNNVLEVSILETYRQLKYPLSEFETFKKVINAAADFNKIVLVLEKKG